MAKVDYTYQSNAHIQRVAKYQQMLERFFNDATSEFCKLFGKAKYDDSSQFFFEDYPTLKKKADSVVNSLSSSIYDVILTGTSAEWRKSNEITDQMVKDLFKSRGVDIDEIKNSDVVDLFNNHDKALDAFQKRKIGGLSLSEKVWNMAEYHRLETQLALSIESGESAAELARKVKKCLKEPDKLFRRVRDKYGELKLSKNAKSYHPGAGAYRSSVRNAQRLARTEINMAYREAEMQRYQDLDFIVGFEVKRSTHPYPCDICESHKGKYPKDFKFNGWHPNCYSKDSEVLTAQGWKRFEDVSFSDEIISLNPYTREIENVCITAKQKYWYEGLMYRFFNKNLDCLVTPEHRMVYLNKSDGEIRYCQAQEYRKGKGAFYRSAENSAVDIDSMIVRGCSYDFDAFCEFMGYWLSDGSLEHDSGVSVSQNVGEKARECIVDCIKALGFTPKMREDRVMFYSSRFNAYLKQFGYSFTKFIPDEIKNASVRQIKIFLDAFIKCDGYERQSKSFVGSHGNVFVSENGERLYFTTSPRMAGDLCQCLLKVGHRPSVKVNDPKYSVKKDGSVIASHKPCYVISECSSSTATVFDKETIPYNDYVYDLTLERNHIMYIKRNGKCFWGSNCRCYVVPILNTQEEFDKQSDAILKGSKYGSASSKEVVDLPAGFKKWYGDNLGRIDRATQIGTLPYYMRDNKSYLNAVRQQVTAKADGGLMQDLAENVAKSIGANCTPINYKSLPSMMRKCRADGCLASDLKDTVRTTIVTSSQEDIEKAISALEADSGELKLLRVKRQSTDVGYTGVICNLELPNGVVCEIQINTAEMIYAKEAPSIARSVIGEDVWDKIFKRTGLEGGLGHKYYEEFRLLDATSDKALEIANKSREYYSHFNSKAKGIANVDTSKLPPKLRQAFEEMTSDEMYSLMYSGRINSFSDYCKTAGLSDEELEILFNAVVDKTDVYMSISSSTLEKKIILGDGKFKSSIETGKGTFGTIGEERAIKERKMFGMADDCGVDDYPKYGFLSKQGQMSYENIVDWGYGDVYVCFDKRKIGNRSTFTIGDSYAHNSYYDRSYLERKARDLKDKLKYNDWDTANVPKWKKELSEIEKLLSKDTAWKEVAPASSLSAPNAKSLIGVNPERVKDILYEGIDKLAASSGQYAECQIYGALSMDDVLRIEVSSKKTKKALEKALKKKGLDIDIVPAKFDQRVKYLKEGITTYDGKASQYAHSLLPRDVDNLGESFVDGLSQRFADDTLGYLKNSKSNPFADIDGFVSFAEQIKSGKATIKEKREFLKIFYEEMHKGKVKGRLPKVWYDDFRGSLGGWTDDLIDMDLLK